MSVNRSWTAYQVTYRAREMKILARWILTNTSGSVVGLAGAGKSNLLGFLSHRPDALQQYLPQEAKLTAVVVPIDLNNLPAYNLATFYRIILRSFYEIRQRFDAQLQQAITDLFRENKTARDPFLSQSALRELLLLLQAQQVRVVLVLDRFDKFCQVATPQMTDSLRGLRDSFKETLIYIAGLRQSIEYLPDPTILGELYEVLDTHICWVGAMSKADAYRLITEETHMAERQPDEATVEKLLKLTGHYPALLKMACHWWQTTQKPPSSKWAKLLLTEPICHYRVQEIWSGLSLEEQQVLVDVQTRADQEKTFSKNNQATPILKQLAEKGLILPNDHSWHINSELMANYVVTVGDQTRGKIWLDRETDILYQGSTPLDYLAPLPESLLRFLVKQPKTRHTHTTLIEAVWPEDELIQEGVATERLYQVIKELRRTIEPTPPQWHYIINWRGRPEGGYQLFPEGRPE